MMTALRLDYQKYRPFPWLGLLLLLLSLAALTLTVKYFRGVNDQAAVLEARMQHLKGATERRVPVAQQSGNKDLAPEVKRANEVLRKLSVPWDDLFLALESVPVDKVTLLTLTPDVEKHTVKISGEADNFPRLMDYITGLEQQRVFGPVYLQSHQVQIQDPEKPVRFTLMAVWRVQP